MPSRSHAWIIWLIASLFYAYQYLIRVMPSLIIDDICSQYNIDIVTYGQFSGIYYLGYALLHLPIGILLDRFGPKYILPSFIILTSLGLLGFIYGNSWHYPVMGRLIIGVGSSAAILGVFKVIRMGFTEHQFTRMLGFSVTIGLVGAIYGGAPINLLLDKLSYRQVVKLFIFFGLVLSIISFVFLPKQSESKLHTSIIKELIQVFSHKKLILICCLSGLMVGPLEGFADVWGVSFFKKVYLFGNDYAASLPSLIFLGMGIGSILVSFVASKTEYYYHIIITCAVIMALAMVLIINYHIEMLYLSMLLILIGICCSYQIIAIYKASSYLPNEVIGSSTALANMVIIMFGYFFHSSISKIIDVTDSCSAGISIIPVGLMIAAIGFTAILRSEKR